MRTSSTNHHRVIGVVNNVVLADAFRCGALRLAVPENAAGGRGCMELLAYNRVSRESTIAEGSCLVKDVAFALQNFFCRPRSLLPLNGTSTMPPMAGQHFYSTSADGT
jgi:hypothetical protein